MKDDMVDFIKKNLHIEDKQEQKHMNVADEIIVPEHSFYEIVLIKAKNDEDIDYIIKQITEEKNPVVLDLSLLESEYESILNEKLKQLRTRMGVEAILLGKADKKIILITPAEIKIIRKD